MEAIDPNNPPCTAADATHPSLRALVQLAAPIPADADDLLAFELQNRAWFEQWINARPEGFYSLDGVHAAISQAEEAARADTGYQYLVRADGQLVGRVNLARVQRPYFNKAELGYRIGAAFAGRGYASAAVRGALARAFGVHRLWRVEATVRSDNAASLRVLHKAGFGEFGRSARSMCLAGRWHDLVHLDLRNEGVACAGSGQP